MKRLAHMLAKFLIALTSKFVDDFVIGLITTEAGDVHPLLPYFTLLLSEVSVSTAVKKLMGIIMCNVVFSVFYLDVAATCSLAFRDNPLSCGPSVFK